MFRIQTTEAGTLTAYTTGSTDTVGRLTDSDGTLLASNDDGGEGTNFRMEETLSAGVYYIEVSPFDDGGAYTIHARFVADDGGGGGREGWLSTDVGVLNDPLSDIQPTVINGPAGMRPCAAQTGWKPEATTPQSSPPRPAPPASKRAGTIAATAPTRNTACRSM